MEHQLLDRKSYQRFCLLEDAITISDRNTIWRFPSASVWRAQRPCSRAWMPSSSAMAPLPGVGQAIDATRCQHIGDEDKERLAQGKAPDWSAAKRR